MAVRVWNQSIDPEATLAGTLTCVARMNSAPQRWMAVSAAHVVAPLVDGAATHPSNGDRILFKVNSRNLEGKLWFWCDLQRQSDGFSNEFDAALIEVQPAIAHELMAALGQPDAYATPQARASVQFQGTASQSEGTFDNRHFNGPLLYSVLGGTFSSVSFKDSLQVFMPAKQGDSGALVTSEGRAVGLLIASDGANSWFLPLEPLLRSFKLDWVADIEATLPAIAADAAAPSAQVIGDPVMAADTLGRTLWGEARGEPLNGIRAVAAVVLNRAMHSHVTWWGRTILGVCRAHAQFSCWNGDDPNLPKLLAVKSSDSRFKTCLDVAHEALTGQLRAECRLRSTHYHTKSILPDWARGHIPCDDIGNHLFYNDIE